MQKLIPLTLLACCSLAASFSPTASKLPAAPAFVYTDASGNQGSAPIVDEYQPKKLTIAPQLDPKLERAATIAEERANAHSRSLCWRYVKDALVASGAVASRPQTAWAKEAGDELVRDYGFTKLDITDPYAAPVGSVLVYTAAGAPGHVEIRTKAGFASDFRTPTPSRRPLLGVYAKQS